MDRRIEGLKLREDISSLKVIFICLRGFLFAIPLGLVHIWNCLAQGIYGFQVFFRSEWRDWPYALPLKCAWHGLKQVFRRQNKRRPRDGGGDCN